MEAALNRSSPTSHPPSLKLRPSLAFITSTSSSSSPQSYLPVRSSHHLSSLSFPKLRVPPALSSSSSHHISSLPSPQAPSIICLYYLSSKLLLSSFLPPLALLPPPQLITLPPSSSSLHSHFPSCSSQHLFLPSSHHLPLLPFLQAPLSLTLTSLEALPTTYPYCPPNSSHHLFSLPSPHSYLPSSSSH